MGVDIPQRGKMGSSYSEVEDYDHVLSVILTLLLNVKKRLILC